MNKSLAQQLSLLFPQTLFAESLAKHCTFHIGGPADAFIEIETKKLKQLTTFLAQSRLPFFILGSGSNILFHDKGFRGVVVKIKSNDITIKAKHIEADAGTNLQFLIAKAGKTNLTQFSGIPGTLGGAVRGNAGANGIEIKDVLISAKILNIKTGAIKTYTNKQLKFKYRNSYIKKNPNLIVLSAKLKLLKTKTTDESLIQKRTQTQPWGLSAGSFFKNPLPQKAGFLIDQCGLKGLKIGGAQISEKHANFIINTGKATQKDVLALARKAKEAVYKKFKIRLQEEVQIVPQNLKT